MVPAATRDRGQGRQSGSGTSEALVCFEHRPRYDIARCGWHGTCIWRDSHQPESDMRMAVGTDLMRRRCKSGYIAFGGTVSPAGPVNLVNRPMRFGLLLHGMTK